MRSRKELSFVAIILLMLAFIFLPSIFTMIRQAKASTGDESATITRQTDLRHNVNFPVWDAIVTWTYDSDDAGAETQAVHINGILLKVIIDIPATTTTATTSQVLIKDDGDHTIFDSGEQAESDTVPYVFNLFEPVTGTIDIIYEPSTYAGSTETPVVTLRGI